MNQTVLANMMDLNISGATLQDLEPGSYQISFTPVKDFIQPQPQQLQLVSGTNTTKTYYYRKREDHTYFPSGHVLENLAPGEYLLEFKKVRKYIEPESLFVNVSGNSELSFAYEEDPVNDRIKKERIWLPI